LVDLLDIDREGVQESERTAGSRVPSVRDGCLDGHDSLLLGGFTEQRGARQARNTRRPARPGSLSGYAAEIIQVRAGAGLARANLARACLGRPVQRDSRKSTSPGK